MNEIEKLATTQLLFPVIKDLVLPKVKSAIEKYFIDDPKDEFEIDFDTYLSNRRDKFSIIDTLVFPNKQTLFTTLYEPLTIVNEEHTENSIIVELDVCPQSLLKSNFRILIEDTAGMGKSTITRMLFLSTISENFSVPFLIELRQLNEQNSILQEVTKQLSSGKQNISEKFVEKLFEQSGFLFLFDGYDEIAEKDKPFVIKDLKQFTERKGNNYYVITSRKEDSLSQFGDFLKFHVQPLTKDQAFNLIRRYDYYSHKPIGDDLIKQLKSSGQEPLNEYLENPLLVSLIYKSYEFKKDIPLRKSQFYRQVYDALFEAHDLSKEDYFKRQKYSNLHSDDFDRVLRLIGYLTAIENAVEYDKDSLINLIKTAKTRLSDLHFQSGDFLKDLLETVPLFKKDGNYYKWSHKSLQDYFAAKFLWIDAREDLNTICEKIYRMKGNARFYNMLDIYSELDPLGYEKHIVGALLRECFDYVKNTYLDITGIDESELIYRKSVSFKKTASIINVKKEDVVTYNLGNDGVLDDYAKLVRHPWHRMYLLNNKDGDALQLWFIVTEPSTDTILELTAQKFPTLISEASRTMMLSPGLAELPTSVVFAVDDSCENILNNAYLFRTVSELLDVDQVINYEQALRVKERIQNREEEKKNDLLNF